MKYVITFDSIHFVMKAEKILNKAGIATRLIPTPRKISADCGIAIEVDCESISQIKTLLENHNCKIHHQESG